eukprot:4209312-Prymnesium_polylepis.1
MPRRQGGRRHLRRVGLRGPRHARSAHSGELRPAGNGIGGGAASAGACRRPGEGSAPHGGAGLC